MPALPPLLPPLELASPSPIYRHNSQPRTRSALSPAPTLPKPACITPTPTSRRRPKTPSFALRRRRLASRVEYAPERLPIHPFDKLPWIASMDLPTDKVRPNDVADLSLIPDDPFISRPTSHPPSDIGPIRRRKPSSRPTPLLSSPLETHPERADDHFFHYASNLFPRKFPERPSTPINMSRLDPAHITFRHLMPVIDDGL